MTRTARNCNLEDVGDAIGYRATRILAGWFAGRNLKVPFEARPTHPLNVLIGAAAFRLLVEEFGGWELWVRTKADDLAIHMDRQAADAFAHGMSPVQVAELLGLSRRRAEQLRKAMRENGMIDYALMDAEPTAPEFAGGLKAILETGNPIDVSGDRAIAQAVEALARPAPIGHFSRPDRPAPSPVPGRSARD